MISKRKIIGFLCSVVFCIVIAVDMPQMARAAGEVAIDATNFPDEEFRSYVENFDKDSNNVLSEEEIADIKEIFVSRIGITNLKGIEHFTALTTLNCADNALTVLDVSSNMALTTLNCAENLLTTLDVSSNTALTTLNCANNALTVLDVSSNMALTTLNCNYNQLTTLDVSSNIALTTLNCDENQLTTLDVNAELTTLNCVDNQLTTLDVNAELTTLNCHYNQLTTLNISKNTTLTHLSCFSNQLTTLDISRNMTLIYLSCYSNQLTTLDISKNTALTYLDCSYNQLITLDVSKNTALTHLSCGKNQLTTLDVNNNTVLTEFYCYENQLTTLDVNKNTALTQLSCFNNQLITLDVSKNTTLTWLGCYGNQLTELKLNSQTYDKLLLYKAYLHGQYNVDLSSLQNITETATNDSKTVSLLKVTDITKPATYKVNGKDFMIIYVDAASRPSAPPSASPSPVPSASPSPVPSASPVAPSDTHIFSDYDYNNSVTGSAVIYGNGINKTINGTKVNNKSLVLYTDILASYKYTLNSKGIVKPAVGKVIVAVTKTNEKPTVNSKDKVTDTSASKIARAKIKNGQITVTAVGKEGGLVYLWVIDTGAKGISAYCPIDVKLAPKKLEVQNTSGSKLTNTKIQNGTTLDVHVSGVSGTVKTEDCTYTAMVDSKYQQYVQVSKKGTAGQDFTITANGLENDKDTKAAITFTCDQNGKRVKFSFTITK